MQVDLVGRINNINTPQSKPLLPLFEAIVNSIYAIDENGIQNGKIDIYIERDNGQLEAPLEGQDSTKPIKSFIVEDNGIGFNDDNFKSFQTSDSTINARRGAKGIGRFHWLNAFNKVQIESIFHNRDKHYKRTFDFILSNEGIENHTCVEIDRAGRETQVRLLNFKDKYIKECPKKNSTIADRIIEHFLPWFFSNKCPQIRLIDKEGEPILLNAVFEENIKKNATQESITIRSQEFHITHLRLYSSLVNTPQIHYLAHGRVVKNENLSSFIKDLDNKIDDEEGKSFVYLAYISGKYLDDKVNSERIDFNLIDVAEDGIPFPDDITKNELNKEVIKNIKKYLNPYLESIKQEKIKKTTAFANKAPQYKPILKHLEEYLDEIPLSASDESLDIALHKINYRMEAENKAKGREILKTDVSQITDLDEYKQKNSKLIAEVTESAKAKLANYILDRKLILDLLSKHLQWGTDKKYKPEEAIHDIIFPLKHTSDEIDYERQNLWVIDEKLAFHNYLASDKPLNQVEPVIVDSAKRPDIIIFDTPFAFVNDGTPYSSIVIIEFKRPGRNYSKGENPIEQVYDYVRTINKGNTKDKTGRLIPIRKDTPFYGYIICDLTPQIKEFAENAQLITAPDTMGYFGYNSKLATYIELISFDKLISDANKRNQMFFYKLALPQA